MGRRAYGINGRKTKLNKRTRQSMGKVKIGSRGRLQSKIGSGNRNRSESRDWLGINKDLGNRSRKGYNSYLGKSGSSVRAQGKREIFFKNKIPLTIENIALLVLPLVLMLILIPSPKEKDVDRNQQNPFVSSNVGSKSRVIVYNVANSIVDELDLEEYIAGVVAAEMPASFHPEALKAQAVAARTFALSRAKGLYKAQGEHFGADVCTQPEHCQGYISKERYLQNRGSEGAWEKIRDAVKETEGIVMTYAGQLINPLYHSNSGGVTENIEQVWSGLAEVPYLKSVSGYDESLYVDFERKTILPWDQITSKIKSKYPEVNIGKVAQSDLEVISYSLSGRIDTIRVGDIKISGTAFRELFSLPSTSLEFIFLKDNEVEVKSKGYGHGVGMSQCGADALAKEDLDYEDILAYFYSGITVQEMNE